MTALRPTSFEAGLVENLPKLRRYARVLRRDAAAADDLAQRCVVRALIKRDLWQPGTDLRAWLFTLLHNLHVNEVRRWTREGATVPIDAVGDRLSCRALQDQGLAMRDLRRAMAALPPQMREVIRIVAEDGRSYEAAAAAMGVDVGTVRSRLSRGRDLLRLILEAA